MSRRGIRGRGIRRYQPRGGKPASEQLNERTAWTEQLHGRGDHSTCKPSNCEAMFRAVRESEKIPIGAAGYTHDWDLEDHSAPTPRCRRCGCLAQYDGVDVHLDGEPTDCDAVTIFNDDEHSPTCRDYREQPCPGERVEVGLDTANWRCLPCLRDVGVLT